MSRVPPNLLYLTIYNPTLKASGPIIGDEEDAEGWMECACGTPAREADRDREAGEEFALW